MQQEKDEYELILKSGLFDKAPRLGKFFRYICERHFDGSGDQVKEYSIALEALGRSGDFDPKRDSIVRVEAHRLRKRLEEYYLGTGAGDPMRIIIPQGQYRPQFVAAKAIPDLSPPHTVAETASHPVDPVTSGTIPPSLLDTANPNPEWRIPVWASITIVCLVLAGIGFVTLRRGAAQAKTTEVWRGDFNEPRGADVRIMAGYHGPEFTDRQGHSWDPDAYYSGGVSRALGTDRCIESQPDPHFLRAQRSGQFRYDIPLRQGTYELRLYFAETDFGNGNPQGGGESSRVFQISVNGQVRFPLFDPLAEAGAPNRLHTRVLKDISPAADGKLHLSFEPLTAAAFLNAFEILHSSPGRIQPVRIVAQSKPVVDSDGRVWAADEYFSGGNTAFRQNVVINHLDKALYEGERYGNFAYRIPLAPGKYRLTLHFAETWFGTSALREPATGQRRFDVFANGVALLREEDVAREAGGSNRSVSKTFDDLEPNAQGVLCLEFVPLKNYAEVNAIEVVETE